MSNPFLAEIRLFPFNFAPKGWAFCQGQILPISQNTALFSLLGTTYGGNGTSNFALPNLSDTAAAHQGQGVGLNQFSIGEQDGSVSDHPVVLVPAAVTVARNMLASSNTTRVAAQLQQEPSLGLNYCIALQGIFPSRN